MADLPFLGCKISLISKCDIRYEGILYCVDAKESTIALSKVRSYGTETRGDPKNYVAPKNDVYDIIIFRASDVKDLRVDGPQPPGLSDPAIISAHHSYPGPTTSSFNNTTNATSTTTSNNNTNPGAPTLNSNGSLSTSGPSNQHQQQKQHQHQKPLLPFMPTGSSNSNNTTSNKADQQQALPTINYSSAVSNAQRNRSNRPEQRDKRNEDVNSTANNAAASSTNQNLKKQAGYDRDNMSSRRDDRRSDNKRDDRRDERRTDRRDERRDDRRDDRRIGGDRRGGEDRDLGGRRGDGRSNMSRGSRSAYDGGNRNHVNSRYNPNSYNQRRGPNIRDENSKGDRPVYRRGPMPGNRRARSGERTGAPRGHRKGAPLKFEGEYDFDEANKLFLELEGKFKGMKLKGGEEKDGESPGEGNNSKSPAGQSESGSGYDSEDQNQKDGDSKAESVSGDFYDRTKSFFDNISCEASERSQGKVNKPDWRKERQLNAETFGVSVNYRRGGYRGRAFGANGYHRR